MKSLQALVSRNEGQSLTEYGLILAVFIVAVVWSLFFLGDKVSGLFSNFNSEMP